MIISDFEGRSVILLTMSCHALIDAIIVPLFGSG